MWMSWSLGQAGMEALVYLLSTAVTSRASYRNSLSLSFFTCKMGMRPNTDSQ